MVTMEQKDKEYLPQLLMSESTEHITRCRDSGQRETLQSLVNNLMGWLRKEETDLALYMILRQYLMAQGRTSLM